MTDNLRDASRRAGTNAVFRRLAVEDFPGELAGFADRLTVLFPWGSLLRPVTLAEPDGLARLRGTCRSGADVRLVFELQPDPPDLERHYLDAGIALSRTPVPVAAARATHYLDEEAGLLEQALVLLRIPRPRRVAAVPLSTGRRSETCY